MSFVRRMLVLLVLMTTPFSFVLVCPAQQRPTDTPDLSELLKQLHSDQWELRAEAYEQLKSPANHLSDLKVRQGLLDLVDRENQLVESTNRDPQGPSVDEKYGEAYAEYVGELGATIDSFADWNDPRQVCIFVHEPYDPGSKFAVKIASHPKVAVPCLIQMYRSDVDLVREEAAAVLAQVRGRTIDQLDPATAYKVKETVTVALRDPDEAVRSSTVRALGKFGGEDVIPDLQQIAETDPSPEFRGHSIRKEASAAIVAIRTRAQVRAK